MRVHGHAVRAIREAQGRSLRDVAGGAEIDDGFLAKIESGAKGASEDTIGRLAGALGVDRRAITYPDPQVVQASPATVRQIAEFLSVPVEVTPQ